jgi:polysaccharide export outer membrane protein
MKFSDTNQSLQVIVILIAGASLGGCAVRSYTKAHSDIVAEAKSKGDAVRSIEEERALYDAVQKKNREKLYALLKQRGAEDDAKSDGIDYVLSPGDELSLSVLGVEKLNGKFRITQTGFVSFPLIGPVKLGGLTEIQATEALRTKLREMLREPEFSLSVTDYVGSYVSVLGAVTTPGKQILMKDKNGLIEVLGSAGGPSKDAGNYMTLVPAEESDKNYGSFEDSARAALEGKGGSSADSGIEIPLAAVTGINNEAPLDIPLKSGDIILVQPAGQIMVEGEVDKRGQFTLGEGATLVSALAAAGGVSYGARLNEVEIVRKLSPTEKVTLVYDLLAIQNGAQKNPYLKNGDVVRVPSATGTRFSQDVFKGLQGFLFMNLNGQTGIN